MTPRKQPDHASKPMASFEEVAKAVVRHADQIGAERFGGHIPKALRFDAIEQTLIDMCRDPESYAYVPLEPSLTNLLERRLSPANVLGFGP